MHRNLPTYNQQIMFIHFLCSNFPTLSIWLFCDVSCLLQLLFFFFLRIIVFFFINFNYLCVRWSLSAYTYSYMNTVPLPPLRRIFMHAYTILYTYIYICRVQPDGKMLIVCMNATHIHKRSAHILSTQRDVCECVCVFFFHIIAAVVVHRFPPV